MSPGRPFSIRNARCETLPACDEVHLWTADLSHPADEAGGFALLSADERERAGRFRFAQHRRRFVLARATLRILLASYLDQEPGALIFSYGAHGKPAMQDAQLHFNLSHTEDLAVIALSTAGCVGVDAEWTGQHVEENMLMESCASEREQAEFAALPAELRSKAFWHWWTRKEAVLKAWGTGHELPLRSFEVTLSPGDARLLVAESSTREQLSLRDLSLGTKYVGSLATCVAPQQLVYR